MANRSVLACAVLAVLLLVSFPASAQKALLLPATGQASAHFFTSEPFADSGAFTVGAGAFAAFANPAATRYFIVSSSSITVVDANGSPVSGSPVALGRPAMAAALASDGGKLLVLTGSSTSYTLLYVFDVSSGIPVQTGTIQSSHSPLAVAGAMDPRTAYVLTTNGLIPVDLSGASPSAGAALPLAGVAAPYSAISQAPTGLLYVNAQDAIYEIDVPAHTVRHTIPLAGFPGRLSFTPDNKAVLANPGAASGNASLAIIDLSNYALTTKNHFGPTFVKLVWTGTGKYYALSSSPRVLYQLNAALADLERAQFAGVNVPSEVLDVFTTDELPLTATGAGGPHYMYVMTLTDLYRYDVKSTSGNIDDVMKVLPFTGALRSGVYLAPVSTKKTTGVMHYGDDQQVVVGQNPLPVVVRSIDADGRATSGTAVDFSPSNTLSRMTQTNTAGFAMAVPKTPIAGENYVITSSVGGGPTYYFNISGQAQGGGGGGGGQTEFTGISFVNGNGQGYLGGLPVMEPVIMKVTNASGEPQPGATVHLVTSAIPNTPGIASSRNNEGNLTNECTVVEAYVMDCIADANGRLSLALSAPSLFNDLQGAMRQGEVVASVSAAGVEQQTLTIYVTAFPQQIDGGTVQYPGQVQKSEFVTPGLDGIVTAEAGQTVAGAVQVKAYTQVGIRPGTPVPNMGLLVRRTQPYCPQGSEAPECTAIQGDAWTIKCDGPAGTVLTDETGSASCDLIVSPDTPEGTYDMYAVVGGNSAMHFRVQVTGAAPVIPVVTSVNIVGGDGQTGQVGSTLPQRLTVVVRDQLAAVMNGQAVTWQVISGAATLVTPDTQTDVNGQADTGVKLGNTAGEVRVRVTVGTLSATFTLTATVGIGSVTKVGGDNQSVALNQPFQPLQVQVRDNQNNPLAGIPVAFNVTGGVVSPASTTVNTGADGVASASFTAGATPGAVTITATAGAQTLTFTLTIRRPGPDLTAASFMNGASFHQGVAAGGVIAIKGPGLTLGMQVEPGACLAGAPDGFFERGLPTTLGRLQVQFGDRLAPIFSICRGVDGVDQVNVQAPMELAATNDAFVVVKTGVGTAEQADTIVSGVRILASQPGVFEYTISDVKYAIALRPDGSIVSPSNPARRGETITLYVTGLGPVLPLIGTNQTGSLNHHPFFVIKVYVNGAIEAQGTAANYAVGKIGMFTVNFTVPNDAPAGNDIPLTVWTVADGQLAASQNVRIAIQ